MTLQKQHYEALLAGRYTWMAGTSFGESVAEQETLLRGLIAGPVGRCLDLGSGSGYQSLALARLGASEVHALETSAALLGELEGYAAGLPITTHLADIRGFDTVVPGPF
ncbi:MAG: hypothetical protein K2X68_05095, partial [Novosphingobium sp.]|nr:hypothetical protein [Novosphingobium sp.]